MQVEYSAWRFSFLKIKPNVEFNRGFIFVVLNSERPWERGCLFCCTSISFCFHGYCSPQALMRLKHGCKAIALPRSSTLHTVSASSSIVSLAGGFSS